MMRTLTIIGTLVLCANLSTAQFTLEQTYPNSGYYHDGGSSATLGQLFMVTLENSGQKYVAVDRANTELRFYNLNHSVYKSISFASLPVAWQTTDILYISEHLFDLDDEIEFMYIVNDAPNPPTTIVFNEDGTILLQVDSAAPIVRANVKLQHEPIYNTANGTKLILSHFNKSALIFGLVGTLSGMTTSQEDMLAPDNGIDVTHYPNPSTNSIRVDYELPPEINKGEIVFYNMSGVEVRRLVVDATFDHLIISTEDLAAGTYIYHLRTKDGMSGGKKMMKLE